LEVLVVCSVARTQCSEGGPRREQDQSEKKLLDEHGESDEDDESVGDEKS
jgi:hypothetical protein